MKYSLEKLFNTALVATVYLLGTTSTRKSIGFSSGTATVWTGLSIIYGVNAGSTTVNLEAGVPVNVFLDLTKITGTSDIASIVIKYPKNFAQNGLKLIPQFVRNYSQREIREAHQILTDNVDRVTEKFSNGVQVDNEETLTSFLYSEGQLKWKYRANSYVPSYPAIDNSDIVYAGSTNGNVYAIYPNGNLKWKYFTGGGIYNALSINDGVVYVGSSINRHMCAIDYNGNLKWKYQTDDYIDSAPAIFNNSIIYFSSWRSYLYAIYLDGTLKWRYQIDGTSSSPAIAADGTIYVGSKNSLYAIYPNGSLKWKYQTGITGYAVSSSPAIAADGTIYVGSDDHCLYAIYPDGRLRWKYETGDAIYSSPVISNDGIVYVGSGDGYLYSVYSNGQLKWRY